MQRHKSLPRLLVTFKIGSIIENYAILLPQNDNLPHAMRAALDALGRVIGYGQASEHPPQLQHQRRYALALDVLSFLSPVVV